MSKSTFQHFFVIAAAFLSHTLYSASGTYQGPNNGSWTDNSNWTGATYPQSSGDIATLSPTSDIGINLGTGISLKSLDFNPNDNGPKLTINNSANGQITFDAGETNIVFPESDQQFGTLTIDPPIVLLDGAHTVHLGENDTYYQTLNIGSLSGATGGTVDVSFTGSFSEVNWSGGGSNLNSISSTGNYLVVETKAVLPTGSPTINVGSESQYWFTNVQDTFSGEISGPGELLVTEFEGTGDLTLNGTLSATGKLSIGGGRLTLTSSPSFSVIYLTTQLANGGDLYFQIDGNETFSGNISHQGDTPGVLNKTGSGTLTLDGTTLDYLGVTQVSVGTLKFVTSPTATSSVFISNSAVLDLAPPTGVTQTLSAPITGEGSLTMSGAGTQILSESQSNYTGNTSITDGILSLVKTPTATPQISIAAGKTLQFAPASGDSQTYAGVIVGDGSVLMNGAGTQNLSGVNTYTTATNVTQGTLNINAGGSIASDVVVDSGANLASTAVLSGDGSVTGDVAILKGKVVVGPLSTSQLNTGNYDQVTGSTLQVSLTRESSGRLVVTGDAALQGTLKLDIQPGAYPKGSSYTVVSATGNLDPGEFSTLDYGTAAGIWTISYVNGNTVNVSTGTGSHVLPVPTDTLKGNERRVADYMFGSDSFIHSNSDLTEVAHSLTILPGNQYKEALLRLSPLAFAAQDQALLFGNVQVAQTFNPYSRGEGQVVHVSVSKSKPQTPYLVAQESSVNAEGIIEIQENPYMEYVLTSKEGNTKKIVEAPCFAVTRKGLFIEPIGIYYNQREREQQIPFDMGTYGVGAGWTQVFGDQFFLTAGVGYTHSNLDWKNNYGNSKWSTVYVAPTVGWFGNRAFANLTVMGAFNFIKADRRIVFPGINRVAKSRYNVYDVLVRGNGGMRFAFFDFIPRSWFQPEVTLNYLTIFTEGYKESGANSINLQVQKRTNYLLQPSFRAKLIKEVITKKFCYAPSLYVGWLANIPLNPDNIKARFTGAPNQTLFNITGYNQTTNQLILGAGFFMKKAEKFELQSDFEVDMLSKYEIYNFKVNFQWLF